MKRFWDKKVVWDNDKNNLLIKTREISFEDVLNSINSKLTCEIVEWHFNKKFAHQKVLYVENKNYIYVVPFEEKRKEIFLRTIYPSYKDTVRLLRGGQ